MKIESLMTDDAVLAELGGRLSQRRIESGLSQAELARQAGVSKRTVERVESGATAQTATLIRMLRALELLDRLEALVPDSGPRPMDLLKLKGEERKRAPRKKAEPTGQPWQWGDES
ncbi:MAG: helix-turn-helix domain-containing protein [Pontiellaceae bacterium]|nr:helix-turn-helix domain-containing protein [Pontiellaceae bacterium]